MTSIRIAADELLAIARERGIELGVPPANELRVAVWIELATAALAPRMAGLEITWPRPPATLLDDVGLEAGCLELAARSLGPRHVELDTSTLPASALVDGRISLASILDHPVSFWLVPSAFRSEASATEPLAGGVVLLERMFVLAHAWAADRDERTGLTRRRAETARKLDEAEEHLGQFVEDEQRAADAAAADLTAVERGRVARQLDLARAGRTKTEATIERLRAALEKCDRDLASEERRRPVVECCVALARQVSAEGAPELTARLLELASVTADPGASGPWAEATPEAAAEILARWRERFRALNRHAFTVHQTRMAVLVERRAKPRRSWRWPVAGAVASATGGALALALATRAPAAHIAPAAEPKAVPTVQEGVADEGWGLAFPAGPYASAPRELKVRPDEQWELEVCTSKVLNIGMGSAQSVRGAYRSSMATGGWRELRFAVVGPRTARPVFAEPLAGPHEVLLELVSPIGRHTGRLGIEGMQASGRSFYRITSWTQSKRMAGPQIARAGGNDYAPIRARGTYTGAADEIWVPPGEAWRIEWSTHFSFPVNGQSGLAVTASYQPRGGGAPWTPVHWQVEPRSRVARALFGSDVGPGTYDVDAWLTDLAGNAAAQRLALDVVDLPEGRRYRYVTRPGAGAAYRPDGDAPVGCAAPFRPRPAGTRTLTVPANEKWTIRWSRGAGSTTEGPETTTMTALIRKDGRPVPGAEVRWRARPEQRVAEALLASLAPGDYAIEVSEREGERSWTSSRPLEVVSTGGHTCHRLGSTSSPGRVERPGVGSRGGER